MRIIARAARTRILFVTPPLVAGMGAIGLFVAQIAFNVHWEMLATLQANTLYKQLTGLLLAIFIARQFGLGLARMKKRTSNIRARLAQHKWQGVLAPLLFFVHSTTLGYAYTLVLSVAFLSNVAVGLFSADVVRTRSRLYIVGWMIAHASLAVLTLALTVFHAWVVFFY